MSNEHNAKQALIDSGSEEKYEDSHAAMQTNEIWTCRRLHVAQRICWWLGLLLMQPAWLGVLGNDEAVIGFFQNVPYRVDFLSPVWEWRFLFVICCGWLLWFANIVIRFIGSCYSDKYRFALLPQVLAGVISVPVFMANVFVALYLSIDWSTPV
ncbi:hypothetical protein [Bifidobacterium jacchi]|uniref:Uncharacterized protein n=1 Tax=Bifidobacterium jacchi TaxID=2490545 RepID=A0A5N5RJR8_9BIFI|nr:hypothetical protein [Bifidobacterium jacchi]KAB5607552.1 hypothetical protein EHS19_04375 [Bifidobacterium jacchi]